MKTMPTDNDVRAVIFFRPEAGMRCWWDLQGGMELARVTEEDAAGYLAKPYAIDLDDEATAGVMRGQFHRLMGCSKVSLHAREDQCVVATCKATSGRTVNGAALEDEPEAMALVSLARAVNRAKADAELSRARGGA